MPDSVYGEESWQRHTRSTRTTQWGDGDVIVTREDLIEAPEAPVFDHDRSEWAFEVHGSVGIPRILLGVLIIRAGADGQLITMVD